MTSVRATWPASAGRTVSGVPAVGVGGGGGGRRGTSCSRSGRGETHPWVCGFGRYPERGGQQPARISASQSPTRQSGAEPRLERIPRAGAARLSAHGLSFTRGSGGGPSTFSLGAHYPVQPEALFARNSP